MFIGTRLTGTDISAKLEKLNEKQLNKPYTGSMVWQKRRDIIWNVIKRFSEHSPSGSCC